MNKKTFRKILAIMLIITLTFAHFLFLAVYAANEKYEAQETSINKRSEERRVGKECDR